MEIERELALTELPFDQYQRYKVVQEIVRLVKSQQQGQALKVLDVGGLAHTREGQPFFPIARFLPEDETMVLDVQDHSAPYYLRVDEEGPLPLPDASFDVVVSCDTLEHVPPERRSAFLDELLRVAQRYVVLAAPFDSEDTRLAEQIFHDFHLRLGMAQPQLFEHRLHGLPDLQALRQDLENRGLPCVEFPSGYLYNWLLMMIIKDHVLSLPNSATVHTAIDRLYNRHFFASDQRAPAYRRVLVISLQGEDEVLGRIAQRFSGPGEPSPWEAAGKAGLAQFLLQLIALEDQSQKAERMDINQDLFDGTVGEILPGKAIGQTFVSHQPNLCRIDVLLATYCRTNTCDLTFRLQAGFPVSQEIITMTVKGANVQDNKWYTFRFPPLLDSRGRTYYFSLESANATSGNALTTYRYSASEFGGRYDNGQPGDGSLAFRTYYVAPTPDERMVAELIALRRELQERGAHLEQQRQRKWWAGLVNLIKGRGGNFKR